MDLPLPRLCVIGTGERIDDEPLEAALTRLGEIFKGGSSCTIVYDVRRLGLSSIPSRRQLRMGAEWAHEHADNFNAALQAIAIVANRLLRATVWLALQLVSPPQPLKICESDLSALVFARACATTKDWR